MELKERYETMKRHTNSRSLIVELGKRLGLDAEQIHTILNNTQRTTELFSLSLGPPYYGSGFYGTVSINDFRISRKK